MRSDLSQSCKAAVDAVLATTSHWAIRHAQQVEQIAVWLYRALEEYHGLGPDEEVLLRTAALLHDVGYPVDPSRHHKVSARIIRTHLGSPFDAEQVELISLLARYHRKALPKLRHQRYRALDDHHCHLVTWLGGILRVADGLDRAHDSAVQWVSPWIVDQQLQIRIGDHLSWRSDQRAAARDASTDVSVVAPAQRAPRRTDRLAVHVEGAMRKRKLLERAVGMTVWICQDLPPAQQFSPVASGSLAPVQVD